MKIHYLCDICGSDIDTLELEQVEESRLGFDCLTLEERADIIKIDKLNGIMYVQSLCDACIEVLGVSDDTPLYQVKPYIH